MNIHENLKAYVDGELTPEEMEFMAKAIEADPALQQEVQFMKMLGFEIKKLATEPAIEGKAELLGKLNKPKAPWWIRHRALALVSCCIAGVAMVSFFASKVGGLRSAQMESEGSEMAVSSSAMEEAMPSASAPVAGNITPERQSAGAAEFQSRATNDGTAKGDLRSVSPTTPPAGNAVPPVDADFRKVIRNAELELKVEDAGKSLAKATTLADSVGGFVESSSKTGQQGKNGTANAVLRVPEKQFARVLDQLRDLGEVVVDNSNGDDVTAEYVDLESRIKVMKAEEDSYITMLRAARRTTEILEIKERLSRVRQERESMQGQLQVMKSQTRYSTINLSLVEKVSSEKPAAPQDWGNDTWNGAVNGLKGVGRFLGQVAIFIFVYSPIWLPVVLLGWFFTRKAKQ